MSKGAGRRVRWHPASVVLHWMTLLLILFQFWVAWPMTDETRDLLTRFELYQLHKSVGLTIAAFVVLRLVLRLVLRAPVPAPEHAGPWLRGGAGAVHAGLYLCVIALPLTGFLMVSSAPIQIPTFYFGWFSIPHAMSPDKAAYELMLRFHGWAGDLLIALGAAHFAAALVHVVVWRDGLLHRMWFGRRAAQG